jgi:hypothetical protein
MQFYGGRLVSLPATRRGCSQRILHHLGGGFASQRGSGSGAAALLFVLFPFPNNVPYCAGNQQQDYDHRSHDSASFLGRFCGSKRVTTIIRGVDVGGCAEGG